MKKRTKKSKYQAGKVIGILAMLVGALIICYPDIREHQTEQANIKLIEKFGERLQKSVTNSTGEDAGSGQDDRSDTDGIITGTENLLMQVQTYNRKGSDCKRSNGFAGSRCCLIDFTHSYALWRFFKKYLKTT